MKVCPGCGSTRIIEDSEEQVCEACGFVLSDKAVSQEREWRGYTQEQRDQRDRVGPPTIDGRASMTMIGPYGRDGKGIPLSSRQRSAARPLAKWQHRIQFISERRSIEAVRHLDSIVGATHLSKGVGQNALLLFQKVVAKIGIRGRSLREVMAAVIYAACKESPTLRTLNEISRAAGLDRRRVFSVYRDIVNALDMKMPVIDSARCVSKIINLLGASIETERRALDLLRKAKEKRLTSGRSPFSIAAAAVYASSTTQEDLKQKEVADAAGITEVTLRNRLKEIRELR